MDATRFDVLSKRFANSSTRRTALRLLSAGLLGTLHPARLAHAQRSDRDEDGLYDDDETDVYFTNPDDWDTDDDNVGDGEEIYNRDNGLGGPSNPLVNDNAAAPPPPADNPAPPPAAPTCTAVGGACGSNTCCQADPNYTYVQCCFDANGAGVCTDVAALGTFLCPDPGVPSSGCAVGMTNCGGFCTNLSTDNGNCGACGQSCPGDSYCNAGACTKICTGGLTNCGNFCIDLQTNHEHCGACGRPCTPLNYNPGVCEGGTCHWYND